MSKFPDDDELLSAIIDGEASAESIASVEADPERSERLANMRAAVELVAAPGPEATAERRSASIAAAMAAATPASPEVTSLAAQRHKREEKKRSIPAAWMAAAAAVVLFVLAIPVLFGGGGEQVDAVADAADVATDSNEAGIAAESARVEADAGEEAAEEAEPVEAAAADEAAEDEAMEEEAADEATADAEVAPSADEAMADDESLNAAGVTAVVQSVEELDEMIAQGSLAPVLAGEDLLAREAPVTRLGEGLDEALATDVNPSCLTAGDGADAVSYDLAVLDPFAGPARLVIIEFSGNAMSRLLDAETCEVIR